MSGVQFVLGVISSILFLSAPAFSGDLEVDAGIEIGGGYEYQVVRSSVGLPESSGLHVPRSDDSQSGARVSLKFHGLRLRFESPSKNANEIIAFFPVELTLDVSGGGNPDSFGRVSEYPGDIKTIRRFIGTLIEASYLPKDDSFAIRAKVARVEYDRDRGVWEWRAIDANVGVIRSWKLADGSTMFDLEIGAGFAVGGTYMKNLGDVEKALGMANTLEHAFTVNPYALMRTGFRGPDWKVELVSSAERRVDLTPGSARPTYQGYRVGVDSDHLNTVLEGQWIFARPSFGDHVEEWSLFGSIGYEYDNLTLSNMFFNSGDAFHSFKIMAGIRGKF